MPHVYKEIVSMVQFAIETSSFWDLTKGVKCLKEHKLMSKELVIKDYNKDYNFHAHITNTSFRVLTNILLQTQNAFMASLVTCSKYDFYVNLASKVNVRN